MRTSPFSRFARACARRAGHPWSFGGALLLVVLWVVLGPLLHWSDSWQLAVNTLSSIVTFLMVFLLQNSQNRDTDALQVKLDELIRANQEARNALLGIEDMSEEELAAFRRGFRELALLARAAAPGTAPAEDRPHPLSMRQGRRAEAALRRPG